jgi:hypothetical protein
MAEGSTADAEATGGVRITGIQIAAENFNVIELASIDLPSGGRLRRSHL